MGNKFFYILIMLGVISSNSFSKDNFEYNYTKFENGSVTLYQGFGEGETPNVARVVFSNAELNMGDEFMAEISQTQRGLDIYFYTPEKCIKDAINEVNLNVLNKNVIFYKKCDPSGSIYVVKSKMGRAFLVKSFKENQFVIIKFLDKEKRVINFNAFGFFDVWESLGGDSL